MNRITLANLQAKVDRINRMTGMPLASYTQVSPTALLPCAGNYHLDGPCGGYALHRIANDKGGVSDVFRCGHIPKRELAGKLDAFISGLEATQPVTI